MKSLFAAAVLAGLAAAPSAWAQGAGSADSNGGNAATTATGRLLPLAPATDTSEEPAMSWRSGWGFVRATPTQLAALENPLQPKKGAPDRIVEICRNLIRDAAKPYGLTRMEAVSAGRPKREKSRKVSYPIDMRLVYSGFWSHEIRTATLTCTIDRAGKVIDARV